MIIYIYIYFLYIYTSYRKLPPQHMWVRDSWGERERAPLAWSVVQKSLYDYIYICTLYCVPEVASLGHVAMGQG